MLFPDNRFAVPNKQSLDTTRVHRWWRSVVISLRARWLLHVVLLTSACAYSQSVHALDSATYVYDDAGRVEQIIHSDGTRVFYTHDEAGNLISRFSVNGTPPIAEVDLSVRITAGDFVVGTAAEITINVNNHGPSEATALRITATLPNALRYIAHASTDGACTAGANLTCDIAQLSAGSETTITLTVDVDDHAPGSVQVNVVTAESDLDLGNNASTFEVVANPPNDIVVFAHSSPSAPRDGDTVTYDIDVTNHGISDHHNAVLTLNPPFLHDIITATPATGTCTVTTSLVCDVGVLALGATHAVAVEVLAGRVGPALAQIAFSSNESSLAGVEYTRILEGFVDSATGPLLELVIGEIATAQYGNRWGSDEHGPIVSGFFVTDGDTDLDLRVTGYDIDYADEVEVVVNGQSVGFLTKGANNALAPADVFALPHYMLNAGVNEVRFLQVGGPTWIWGVTNIELQPSGTLPGGDITVTLDAMDNGQYGNGYGSFDYGGEITVIFQDAGTDLVLDVTGFDIDTHDEVRVLVNGIDHGFLAAGPNNGLNGGDQIVIPAALQQSGRNEIQLKNKSATYIWGVTGLHLHTLSSSYGADHDVALSLNVVDSGQYGHGYGSVDYGGEVTAMFTGSGVGFGLEVTGYDLDSGVEVSVSLNGYRIGYLRAGPNNGLNAGDVFALPPELLLAGRNVIRFFNPYNNYIWGVTQLKVTTP